MLKITKHELPWSNKHKFLYFRVLFLDLTQDFPRCIYTGSLEEAVLVKNFLIAMQSMRDQSVNQTGLFKYLAVRAKGLHASKAFNILRKFRQLKLYSILLEYQRGNSYVL